MFNLSHDRYSPLQYHSVNLFKAKTFILIILKKYWLLKNIIICQLIKSPHCVKKMDGMIKDLSMSFGNTLIE